MKETIGFRSFTAMLEPQLIKRDALMFRRVGVPGCDVFIDILNKNKNFAEKSIDLHWLIEQGIVFDAQLTILDEDDLLDNETRKLLGESQEIIKHYEKKIEQRNPLNKVRLYLEEDFPLPEPVSNKLKEQAEEFKRGTTAMIFLDLLLRPLSAYYRNNINIDAYPLFYGDYPELSQQTASVGDVIDITINQLPTPDDSTSWEQIIDFRDDPDTEKKFLGLRVWMNEIARAKLSPLEIEQKLEWLLQEYRDHMKVHQMKTNASTLETIVVSIAEFAEDLAKRNFSKLAKGLFSVRHRKIALLEGELKTPGREIAFISKAQDTFR